MSRDNFDIVWEEETAEKIRWLWDRSCSGLTAFFNGTKGHSDLVLKYLREIHEKIIDLNRL